MQVISHAKMVLTKKQLRAIKPRFKYRVKMLDKFWYWINERHRIYVAKEMRHELPPWTKDKILREYKFTNVFRQLDRVTRAWTERYARLLGSNPSDQDILFHCMMFRLFNWPATYDALFYGMGHWKPQKALQILDQMKAEGKQIFTGAYIIPNAGKTEPKTEIIVAALDEAYRKRVDLITRIKRAASMEDTCAILQEIPTVGPFIAYELACDLSHTRILAHADDRFSWANPGPGAMRGIHRLLTGKKDRMSPRPNYIKVMHDLLMLSHKYREKHVPPMEMRDIEHSLCEFDKYMRVKNGEGRPRSKYKFTIPPWEVSPTKPAKKARKEK